MTATTASPNRALTVARAGEDLRQALDRARIYNDRYASARSTRRPLAVTQARGEYGLVWLEWAEALIARESAIDQARTAYRLAAASPPAPLPAQDQPTSPIQNDAQADPSSALPAAQARLSRCQRRYEDIRTGDPVATAQARREWGEALKGWIWAVLACKAAEDDTMLARRTHGIDTAKLFHPRDAFPPLGSREQQVAGTAKERDRRDNIERHNRRYAIRDQPQDLRLPSRSADSPC